MSLISRAEVIIQICLSIIPTSTLNPSLLICLLQYLTALLEYIVLIDTLFLQDFLNTYIFTCKMPTYIITKSPMYRIQQF